jgi:adenylyl cyclase-associated protein
MDGCKKTALVFDEAISSVDFINCQSVQAQVLKAVPTISIDKTDGCMVYLSKDSLNCQLVSAKSSEMNILVPDASGEFKEFAIAEQFRTHWNGKRLVTEVSEMNFSG